MGCVRQVWLMKPNGQRSSHLKPNLDKLKAGGQSSLNPKTNLFPLQKHRPSVWPHSSVPSSSQLEQEMTNLRKVSTKAKGRLGIGSDAQAKAMGRILERFSHRHSSLHPSPQMPGAQGRHSPVTWWQVVPLEQEHVSVQLEPHLGWG